MLSTNNVEDPCTLLVFMVNDILEHLPNKANIEDEVNVEAHVEATTFICNNEGVNQEQTDLEENVKYKELMEDALLPLYPSYRKEHTRLAVVVKKYNTYKENLIIVVKVEEEIAERRN
ncbi:hypothetical protein GIB67_022374 [Kingdonia uniflora]|uniref:Uncharacterized protein n=1 Tax=Kingdonia uniflora TaxID=39325 RepID=A0A7J7N6D9_9MAGN|nr:hypothetical protein GIB67_022374 [Kingdonia uniflora]